MRRDYSSIFMGVLISLVVVVIIVAIAMAPKKISEREFETNVTIEDTYHRSAYTTRVKSGNSYRTVYHSAKNIVYVMYGNEKYSRNNREDYKYCKDLVGKTVKAIMEEIKYDNGSIKYKLVDIVN